MSAHPEAPVHRTTLGEHRLMAEPVRQTRRVRPLPVGSPGPLAVGWWGMWCVLLTEAALFAYLLFGYFYLATQASTRWPPNGPPALTLAAPNTIVLIVSSVFVIWAERLIERGRARACAWALLCALVLGIIFAGVQLLEWSHQPFGLSTDAYGSSFFVITGFHLAHVAAGLLVLLVLFISAATGRFDRHRHAPLSIGALYWHFVDAVWIAVFASLYLSPRAF